MSEQEKIISELQSALEWCQPEDNPNGSIAVKIWAVREAVELLKEQEAVEPVKKEMIEVTARYEFDCPCGAPLLIGQPYCADCGRSVKWE